MKKAIALISLIFIYTAFSLTSYASTTEVPGTEAFLGVSRNMETEIDSAKIAAVNTLSQVVEQDICVENPSKDQKYAAELVEIRRQLRVNPGEAYKVRVYIKNTGNMTVYSDKSNCLGPVMNLGADNPRDRQSMMYTSFLPSDITESSNWLSPSRIIMDQYKASPGDTVSFTFWSIAGKEANVIKEYFTPVIEDVKWLDEARGSVELMIGTVNETMEDTRKRLSYATESGSVMGYNINGEKLLLVDISDQTVSVRLDNKEIKKFRVSTGKASTPTPYGETKIILKQEVRVGRAAPHYVMPKFMMFRAGGYGFHALPSLRNDGGVFWTEAYNHIGRRVSHGCIRLLPNDASYLFDFTDVGTRVVVQP